MTTTEADGDPHGDHRYEEDLPPDIEKALREFLKGVEDRSPVLDCLWGELYGAINANMWAGNITAEHAGYLRSRYLFGNG